MNTGKSLQELAIAIDALEAIQAAKIGPKEEALRQQREANKGFKKIKRPKVQKPAGKLKTKAPVSCSHRSTATSQRGMRQARYQCRSIGALVIRPQLRLFRFHRRHLARHDLHRCSPSQCAPGAVMVFGSDSQAVHLPALAPALYRPKEYQPPVPA
jgi:hypothetical protein